VEAEHLRVAVIGAGFAGLCMAIKLLEAGETRFAVFEKSDGVSGTWHDHTYPGLVCDVPSHLYSYSFELNPDWSRVFSPQAEIKAYVERCVEKYGLRPYIRNRSEVRTARYDESAALWHLELADGRRVNAQFIVSGIGGLSRPNIPDFAGREDFAGEQFHTARWPEGFDPAGKRIAVIGSAASAVQIVPEIAKSAARVEVFQRTPNWIFPRPDRAYPESLKAQLRKHPWLLRGMRNLIYIALDFVNFRGFKEKSWWRRFREWQAVRFIKRTIPDPEMQKKLIPDYPLGCKRLLLASDFYPALTRDNVSLHTEAIERIGAEGISTTAGVVGPVDTIIFATGYKVTDPLGPLDIRGVGGKSLKETWGDSMYAYKGVALNDFPNLFFLLGPNTGLGHNSIIFMIEQQVGYVLRRIAVLGEGEAIEVREDALREYNDWLHAGFKGTVWTGGCKSWYLDAQGRNPTLWPHSTTAYWRMMKQPDPEAYVVRKAVRQHAGV
jgi:cation diffusion facilitator CzcD-associated flavoprotein CzcO